MNPMTTNSSPRLLLPFSNILVATQLLDEIKSSLQDLCQKPSATMQMRWHTQVGLLRLEFGRVHATLSSLYYFLDTAASGAPGARKAIDSSPSIKTIENSIMAISATARQSLSICSEALTDLGIYRGSMIGSALHSRECEKFEGKMRPQIGYMQNHRSYIQDARNCVEQAVYASRNEGSFIASYRDLTLGSTAKDQKEVALMTIEKHFWTSPFRLDFTLKDPSTGLLASKLLEDYCSTKGLKKLKKQFVEMGAMWGKGRKGGLVLTGPTNGELEEVYSTLCGNIRHGLKAYLPSDPSESSGLTQDTSKTIDHLGNWQDHKHFQQLIIAVGGAFSHGKSSFLNAIMGEQVLPSAGANHMEVFTGQADLHQRHLPQLFLAASSIQWVRRRHLY